MGLALREPPGDRSVELTFTRGNQHAASLARLSDGALDPFEVGRSILMSRRRSLSRTPYEGVRVDLAEASFPRFEPESREPTGRVRAALEVAVDRAIGNARRVAVMTGGGLDSAALLGIAARRLRARGGEAFGVALDYRAEGDDRPYLKLLERQVGCTVVRIAPEDAGQWRGLVDGVDGAPFFIAMGPLEAEAMRRARELGAERLLTGAGGDELFDGHPSALAGLVEDGELRSALGRARTLRGFGKEPGIFRSVLRPWLARRAPKGLRMFLARRGAPFVPAWAGPLLRDIVAKAQCDWLAELAATLDGRGAPARAPAEADRVEQAWYRHQQEVIGGLPRWDPYLDRDLVRVVHACRPHELLHGDVRRGLFREAIRGDVPEPLRLRLDKAAFEPAMFRWVESVGGFASFAPLATGERLAALGLVEPTAFRAAFEAFTRTVMVGYDWSSVWPALTVEAFLRARGR